LIIDENVQGYLRSLEPDLPEELAEIENFGHLNEVPIIKKDAQQVLRFLIKDLKPKKILEVGTAIGFSASLMNYWSEGKCEITTLEKVPEKIELAKANFSKLKIADSVRLIEGDAAESLKALVDSGEKFDFVFLDAAKAQYSVYLESIEQLLTKNGVLLTDNILQEGSVAQSKFSVTRRDRTIHKRMREFIKSLFDNEAFNSMIIPIGDGMLLCKKNDND